MAEEYFTDELKIELMQTLNIKYIKVPWYKRIFNF